QGPDKLGGGGHQEGLGTIGRRGADDARSVVNGQGSPQPEAVLGQAEVVADGGEDEQGGGVEQEDNSQGGAGLLVVGSNHWGRGGNGTTATDGGAHAD